jgi:hypothetical protein
MKKIMLVFLLVACYGICLAQIPVEEIDTRSVAENAVQNFVKPPPIGSVGSTTDGIVNLLSNKLLLPAVQKPKLSGVINGFLGNKKNITSLADTNPAGYLDKFIPLQKGLFGSMKGIMGTSTFNKFLALKPSGNNAAGNVLSHLFY